MTERSPVPSGLKNLATLCAIGLVVAGCSSTNNVGVAAKFTDPASVRPPATSLGNRHLQSGRYGSAIGYFSRRMAASGEDMEALKGLAIAYDKIGRFDLSRRYYQKALSLEPENVALLNNYGYSLMLQSKSGEALPYLRRAEGLDGERRTVAANLRIAQTTAEPRSAELADRLENDAFGPLLSRVTVRAQQLMTLISAEFAVQTSAARVDPKLVAPVPKLEPRAPVIRILRRPANRRIMAVSSFDDGPSTGTNRRQAIRLEVSNGTGVNGMAARLRAFIENKDQTKRMVRRAALTNASHFAYSASVITYRSEFQAQAERLAAGLPFAVKLYRNDDLLRDVRLVLGANAVAFDQRLRNDKIQSIES